MDVLQEDLLPTPTCARPEGRRLWFPDQAVQRRKPDRVPGQGTARRQERSSLVIVARG
jgi:hypothetical protein